MKSTVTLKCTFQFVVIICCLVYERSEKKIRKKTIIIIIGKLKIIDRKLITSGGKISKKTFSHLKAFTEIMLIKTK